MTPIPGLLVRPAARGRPPMTAVPDLLTGPAHRGVAR